MLTAPLFPCHSTPSSPSYHSHQPPTHTTPLYKLTPIKTLDGSNNRSSTLSNYDANIPFLPRRHPNLFTVLHWHHFPIYPCMRPIATYNTLSHICQLMQYQQQHLHHLQYQNVIIYRCHIITCLHFPLRYSQLTPPPSLDYTLYLKDINLHGYSTFVLFHPLSISPPQHMRLHAHGTQPSQHLYLACIHTISSFS